MRNHSARKKSLLAIQLKTLKIKEYRVYAAKAIVIAVLAAVLLNAGCHHITVAQVFFRATFGWGLPEIHRSYYPDSIAYDHALWYATPEYFLTSVVCLLTVFVLCLVTLVPARPRVTPLRTSLEIIGRACLPAAVYSFSTFLPQINNYLACRL